MKINLAMISIDRSEAGENYFDRTMMSFDRSGLWQSRTPFEFHVYDGGSRDQSYLAHWKDKITYVHDSWFRMPAKTNFGRAMLGAANYDCDWVLMCEDDIGVCKGFLDGVTAFIERWADVRYRVITFYTPYREIKESYGNVRAPYWDYPVKDFYGTQCLAMRQIDAMMAGAYILADTKYSAGAYDLILKEWHQTHYPDYPDMQATVPCFVEHMGKESVINPGRYHTSGLFLGEEWSPQV
jgi:hypothetical protein